MKILCPQADIVVLAHIHHDYTAVSLITTSPYLFAIYLHNAVDGFPYLAFWCIWGVGGGGGKV